MQGQTPPTDLKERTIQYALQVVRMSCALPRSDVAQVLGKQALRSGTSAGAQYREAARARSKAEFISKLESALQELDETDYWLDLLERAGIGTAESLQPLRTETDALIRILTASAKTAKSRP